MKVKLVGYNIVNYVNRDGKKIQGIRLFCTFPERFTVGEACEVFYVSGSFNDVVLGEYQLNFNRFGRVISFDPL